MIFSPLSPCFYSNVGIMMFSASYIIYSELKYSLYFNCLFIFNNKDQPRCCASIGIFINIFIWVWYTLWMCMICGVCGACVSPLSHNQCYEQHVPTIHVTPAARWLITVVKGTNLRAVVVALTRAVATRLPLTSDHQTGVTKQQVTTIVLW